MDQVYSLRGVVVLGVVIRRSVVASVVLVVLLFAVGFYLYPRMRVRMAIHWGLSGEADGYGSRFLGLFLISVFSLLFLPFMLVLPRLDPSRGIERFRGGYDWFRFGFLARANQATSRDEHIQKKTVQKTGSDPQTKPPLRTF